VTEKEIILSPPITGGGGVIINLEELGIGASLDADAEDFLSFLDFFSGFFVSDSCISEKVKSEVVSSGSLREFEGFLAQEKEESASKRHKIFVTLFSLDT
jgi:predicted ATP-grasp superfamily ATP-dependent carboligase